MKSAIILHGMPSKEEYYDLETASPSNSHWIPWLQKQLLSHDILAQTPELPLPFEPVYEDWLAVFNKIQIDEQTILIGHSCGAGFLVRWLTETNIKVGKVALVAPFLDPNHNEVHPTFFDFKIDQNLVSKTQGLRIFNSTDDSESIMESVKKLQTINHIQISEFTNKGHFTLGDMKTEKFPELVEWILS